MHIYFVARATHFRNDLKTAKKMCKSKTGSYSHHFKYNEDKFRIIQSTYTGPYWENKTLFWVTLCLSQTPGSQFVRHGQRINVELNNVTSICRHRHRPQPTDHLGVPTFISRRKTRFAIVSPQAIHHDRNALYQNH